MKIIQLTAENVMGIKAAQVTPRPDGSLVIVAGRNGQGKSSLLESLWLALGGGAASRQISRPVRQGQEEAHVRLDLGDLTVTRTWTEGGERTQLKVEAADGARHTSPQALLDSLVGRTSFDPLAFSLKPPRAQRADLLGLLDLPFDPDEIACQRADLYAQRTEVGRGVRVLAAQFLALPEPKPGLPEREQGSAEVLAELRAAQEAVAAYAALLDRHEQHRQRIAELEREVVELGKAVDDIVELLVATPAPANPALIEARLTDLEATNRAVRAAGERRALDVEHRHAKDEFDRLTDQIEELDRGAAAAIAAAPMPVEGLGFTEDGVTYQGIPFAQCSGAERLRISMAIAMAGNPKVRIIRVTDGSLLDADNLALIERMAAAKDFQVWLERVGTDDKVGVVIEDGTVVAVDGVAATPAPPWEQA